MLNRRIVENIFSGWANIIVTVAIAFFISPFVVKTLGKELYGIWVLVVSITGYFSVLDLGISTAIVRYISSSTAQNDHGKARAIYSTSLAIFSCISLGILLVSFVLGYFFQDLFKLYSIPRTYLYAVFMVSALDLACSLLFSVFSGSLSGLQEFKFINGSTILFNIIKSLLLIVLLKLGYGLLTLALLQLLVSCFKALSQYIKIRNNYRFMLFSTKTISKSCAKMIYDYSVYSFIIAIALKLLFYTDSVVIGAYINVSEIVFYAIPASLIDYMEKFIWAIVAVLVPVISASEATGENTGNARFYVIGTRYILLVSMPIMISLYFFGQDFIRIWMGAEIGARSGVVLKLLLVGFGFSFSQLLASGILKGVSKHKFLAYILTAEAAANVALSLLLAKPYGITGVAIGTLVPLVLATCATIIFTCRLLEINVFKYLYKAYSAPLLGTVAALVFVYANPFSSRTYLAILVSSACVTVSYLIATLPLALEREHIKVIAHKAFRTVIQPG
ncbi:MAG: oligosaccharide flippase family protein [Geobacteraceae bacterium]|nr:oligosaccharide flippase family protein [Geobacteraceae bacterium]